MKLVWSKRANKEWKTIATYINEEFGNKSVIDFLERTKYWERHLMNNPEIGSPEPLLSDKRIKYRSLIFSKHNKFIYYIENDTIRISDIWDMRRKPEVLASRIKSQ